MNNAILIVDDSLTVRADLEEAFTAAGLPTIACASVAEARSALATQEVALIILDVILPDGDGIDLLKEIRATPAGARIPVLMLSSEAEVQHRIRGLITGSNDYVGKPYDRDYVVARTRELLGNGKRSPEQPRTTVLLIDDSPTFREKLGESLRAQGIDVLIAATGEEGLRSAAVNRPAAVVVDGVLPGIDGATVVRKLRLDAALRHTPCILLTGSDDFGAELHALDSGADAFVRKEEDIDMILARVTAALRNAGNAGLGPKTASLLGPKKILAVDDSPTYLQELGDILGGEGYDVILACSGEEALEMIAVQPVDCILLDRLMPGLGGTETCRRIKASSATRDIPLIMLTAMEDREAMIEGLSTGADDYVLKSNELDVLKARVRAQLRRKQFEDESRRIRMELMSKELEATEMRAARELATSRAELLSVLEQKNHDLETVNAELRERQTEIAEKNHQLEEASRLKSEFLANMSHELRTPLNAIIGFSELLKDDVVGKLTSKQNAYVTQVFNSGQHLLSLINDILDLSKVEAGRMVLEPEEFTLNALLQTCLNVFMDKAVKRHIALKFESCPGNDLLVADSRKLKQIVYNLLSNAVKFSSDRGEVTLSARPVARSEVRLVAGENMATRILPLPPSEFEDFLEIRVSDCGIGIHHQDLPNLFQAFVQLDSSMARHHEGTGLGLALVGRLATLHDGTVGVSSVPGKGTQFTVWIPWRKAGIDARLIDSSHSPSEPGTEITRVTGKALVIEDDRRAAELLRVHLESVGFQVHCAYDAAAALDLAVHQFPDVITLDLLLPDSSGWEVLDQIKANPVLDKVPIVIVSVIADEQKGFVIGVAKMLQKPVARKTLLDAVFALGLGDQSAPEFTVLVIDDDPQVSEWIAGTLDGKNCKVLRAYDGYTAIDTARKTLPDLIILDLMLPDISGFEVLGHLKHQLDTASVPILVLTAKTIDQLDRKQLNGKVLQIMEKGNFNRQQFLAEVNRALRRH